MQLCGCEAARGSLTAGAFLVILTAIFLFNISFGIYWPLLLVLGGGVLLVNALLPG